jgi:hypothetical protein
MSARLRIQYTELLRDGKFVIPDFESAYQNEGTKMVSSPVSS